MHNGRPQQKGRGRKMWTLLSIVACKTKRSKYADAVGGCRIFKKRKFSGNVIKTLTIDFEFMDYLGIYIFSLNTFKIVIRISCRKKYVNNFKWLKTGSKSNNYTSFENKWTKMPGLMTLKVINIFEVSKKGSQKSHFWNHDWGKNSP